MIPIYLRALEKDGSDVRKHIIENEYAHIWICTWSHSTWKESNSDRVVAKSDEDIIQLRLLSVCENSHQDGMIIN